MGKNCCFTGHRPEKLGISQERVEARVFFPSFSYRAFAVRNRWMVDRADRVIAVYTGCSGGTEQTLCYARRRGVEVVLLGNSNT